METSERARLRALCEAATPGPECTGISARWCPRCGDCTCPGDPDRGDPMDDPRCPLHASSSPHGEGAETADLRATVDTMQAQLDAHREWLATAERERDEARAEAARLRAELGACKGALDRHIGLRIGDRVEARLAERCACSEFAESSTPARRTRPSCYRCDDTGYVETRTFFPATKYQPAGTVVDSVRCPRCGAADHGREAGGGA